MFPANLYKISPEKLSIPVTKPEDHLSSVEVRVISPFLPKDTPHDRLFATLFIQGFIDASGLIIEDRFKDFTLPPLNQTQMEEIDRLLNHTFIMHNKEGPLCETKLIDSNAYMLSQNKRIESIEIVGGFVRKLLLSTDFCREAFSVLSLKDVITEELIECCRSPLSDYDIRINSSTQEPQDLRKFLVRFLTFQAHLSVDANKQKEVIKSGFTKYALVKDGVNDFAIASFGDQKGNDLEILLIKTLARTHLFISDSLRIEVSDFYKNKPIHVISDHLNGWQSLIDLLTKNIHVFELSTVNQDGLAMLMSYVTRGFTWNDREIFKTLSRNPDAVKSVPKCIKNHYSNDPGGAFAVLFNARTFLSDKVIFCELDFEDDKDSSLYELYQKLHHNPDLFEFIYSTLHIAAFENLGKNSALTVVLKSLEGAPALQIQFGKHYLLQPLNLEKAFQTLHNAKSDLQYFQKDFTLPKDWEFLQSYFPSDEVLLTSNWAGAWIRAFIEIQNQNLCLRAYGLWNKLETDLKNELSKAMFYSLASFAPGLALGILNDYPLKSKGLSALLAAFQNPCCTIEFQSYIETLYIHGLKIVSKKRPEQKILVSLDPFTHRLIWFIKQLINFKHLEEAEKILSKAILKFWIKGDDPAVQSLSVGLCNYLLDISPAKAEKYFNFAEIHINLPLEGMYFLLSLTERLLEENSEAAIWVNKIHLVTSPPEYQDRIQTIIERHLSQLIRNHKPSFAATELEVYKNRLTLQKRSELLIAIFEENLDLAELDKATYSLKQLSMLNLTEAERLQLSQLIERCPHPQFLMVSNILTSQKKIELMLQIGSKVDEEDFQIALFEEALAFDNRSKISEAIGISLNFLSTRKWCKLKEIINAHDDEIIELIKNSEDAERLCDYILQTQKKNLSSNIVLWMTERISMDRIPSLLTTLPEGVFPKTIIPLVMKMVEWHLGLNSPLAPKTLLLLGQHLLRCPPSDYCLKVADQLPDLWIRFSLLKHTATINWKLLELTVNIIANGNDANLKRKVELALRNLKNDSSIACKSTQLLALRLLIELKDPYLITLVQNLGKSKDILGYSYVESMLKGFLFSIEKHPLASLSMALILKRHTYHDLDMVFIETLLRKYDLNFFKIAVILCHANYEGILNYFKTEKNLEQFVKFMSKFVECWNNKITPKILDPFFTEKLIPTSERLRLRHSKFAQNMQETSVYAKPREYCQLLTKYSQTLLEIKQSKKQPFYSVPLNLCFRALTCMDVNGKDSITYKIAQEISTSKICFDYFRSIFEFIGPAVEAIKKIDILINYPRDFSEKEREELLHMAFDFLISHMITHENNASLIDAGNRLIDAFTKTHAAPGSDLFSILETKMTPNQKQEVKKVFMVYLEIFEYQYDRLREAIEENLMPIQAEKLFNIQREAILLLAKHFSQEEHLLMQHLTLMMVILMFTCTNQQQFEKNKSISQKLLIKLGDIQQIKPFPTKKVNDWKRFFFPFNLYFDVPCQIEPQDAFFFLLILDRKKTEKDIAPISNFNIKRCLKLAKPYFTEFVKTDAEKKSGLLHNLFLSCSDYCNIDRLKSDSTLLNTVNWFICEFKLLCDGKNNKVIQETFKDIKLLEGNIEMNILARLILRIEEKIIDAAEKTYDLSIGIKSAKKAGCLNVSNKINIYIFNKIKESVLPNHLILLAQHEESSLISFIDEITEMLCFLQSENDPPHTYLPPNEFAKLIAADRQLRKTMLESWISVLKTSKKQIVKDQARRVEICMDSIN
jgi:hypothetical protein